MDKISLMIRGMLLRWPTLYKNRFDAFAEMMTNSCFEWNDRGELVELFPDQEECTPETMVDYFRAELKKRCRECDPNQNHECLHALHRQFVTDAERDLHDAEFVAAHIDTYASSWAGVSYVQAWAWLHRTDRYGVSKYWSINNKPDSITEPWRVAIRDWLDQLMAPANGLMGINETNGFVAIPRYAEIFNWLKKMKVTYDDPHEPERERRMRELVENVVRELKNRPSPEPENQT